MKVDAPEEIEEGRFAEGQSREVPEVPPELEQLDEGGLSPLQRAVLAGDVHRVDDLLSQGADPDRVVVSADGASALPS